jgi:hypothetical protein
LPPRPRGFWFFLQPGDGTAQRFGREPKAFLKKALYADTALIAWPGPKHQRAGAVQDAGANGDGFRERKASWTAVARHRFSPRRGSLIFFRKQKRDMIYGNALIPANPWPQKRTKKLDQAMVLNLDFTSSAGGNRSPCPSAPTSLDHFGGAASH